MQCPSERQRVEKKPISSPVCSSPSRHDMHIVLCACRRTDRPEERWWCTVRSSCAPISAVLSHHIRLPGSPEAVQLKLIWRLLFWASEVVLAQAQHFSTSLGPRNGQFLCQVPSQGTSLETQQWNYSAYKTPSHFVLKHRVFTWEEGHQGHWSTRTILVLQTGWADPKLFSLPAVMLLTAPDSLSWAVLYVSNGTYDLESIALDRRVGLFSFQTIFYNMVSLHHTQSGTASTRCLYGKAAVIQSLPSVGSHCHDMRHGVCKYGLPCPGVAHLYGTRRGSRSAWGTGSLVNKYRETAAESLLNKHVRVGRTDSSHHSFPTPSTSSAAPPPKPTSGFFPQSQRQHSQM